MLAQARRADLPTSESPALQLCEMGDTGPTSPADEALQIIADALTGRASDPPWYVKAAVPLAFTVALAAAGAALQIWSAVAQQQIEIARIDGRLHALENYSAKILVMDGEVARLKERVEKNENMREDVEAMRAGMCTRWQIACRAGR